MTPPKPSYKRGDVVLVLYPNPDLRTAKARPALIVHADHLQTGLSQVIVAMITSRLFRATHLSRVVVEVSTSIGQRTGLLTDSVVMTDNTVSNRELSIARFLDRCNCLYEVRKAGQRLQHRVGVVLDESAHGL